MDLMSLSAKDLSRKCLNEFDRCLTFHPSQRSDADAQSYKNAQGSTNAGSKSLDERFEYRLADFNLWIDGIGALAPSKASLDTRLKERPIDLSLAKGNLIMLYHALEDCTNLLENGLSLEEALLDIDSALGSLVSLSLAIRRTGRKSRLHKADRLFEPEEHAELRKHLECIIVLRPDIEGRDEGYNFHDRVHSLTPVQKRLITANLRRRNRFIQAQLHSLGLKKRSPGFELPAYEPIEVSIEPVISQDQAAEILSPVDTEIPSQPGQPSQRLSPTMSVTSATLPESKLQYKEPALKKTESAPMTVITQITASARYPRPRLSGPQQQVVQCPCCCQTLPVQEAKNNTRWRKHLSEDIRPYTCIFDNCPTPDVYYSSRVLLERHVRQDHQPTWQCPICSDGLTFTTMTDMMDHIHGSHQEHIEREDLSAMVSASAQTRMGIDACPLCDVTGVLDSPELIDHVLEHVHDFSLRSLPWPKSTSFDLGGEVGSFDLDEDGAASVTQWLERYEHKSKNIKPTLHLSGYDLNRLSIISEQMASQKEDRFGLQICFADEHGDESAAAETDISQRSLESTEETTQDDDKRPQREESARDTRRRRFGVGVDPLSLAVTTTSLLSSYNRFYSKISRGRKESLPSNPTIDDAYHGHPGFTPVLEGLFKDLRGTSDELSKDKFTEFLHKVQCATPVVLPDQESFDEESFKQVLMRSHMDAVAPLPPKDTSRPITHYFINTSHNTYLTGLDSSADADAYRDALLDGCRWVEIDVWNGDKAGKTKSSEGGWTHQPPKDSSALIPKATKRLSRLLRGDKTETVPKVDDRLEGSVPEQVHTIPDVEPVVTHDWTLTTHCGFREVCVAIRESAFVNNDLPVIVSLQVHAGLEQQGKMVEIMREEWRSLLLEKPLRDYHPDVELPPLEDLRYRILIKCSTPTLPTTFDWLNLEDGEFKPDTLPSRIPILKSLACLAIYTRGQPFHDFATREAKEPPHVFSVSESKLQDLNRNSPEELIMHNEGHFFRVFPSNKLDSSNLNPLACWDLGVQMAAMNRKTFDTGMMLNQAMFADEEGWVLKTLTYLTKFNRHTTRQRVRLSIFVFEDQNMNSGWTLDTTSVAEIFNGQYSSKGNASKVRHVQTGTYGHAIELRPVGHVIDMLSILVLKFHDPTAVGSGLFAWSSIRLDRLNQGYRFIPLWDRNGMPKLERILVHINIWRRLH